MTSAPDGDGDGDEDADGRDAIDPADAGGSDDRAYVWQPEEDGDIVIWDDQNPLAWIKSSDAIQESDWR